MPLRSLRALGLCVGLLFGLAPIAPVAPVAMAEPSAATSGLSSATLEGATQTMAKIKLDASGKPEYLARFSDGPRRVARARGAALARAERLGIGGHELARKLLWTRPDPALLAEAHGETPKKLLWPVVGGTWGRGFGFTRTLRPELAHNGVDIGAKEGDVVRAVADGIVVYSDNGLLGFGNCVMILHPNGFLSLYAHTERTTVQPGWRVKRGERVALVGHTGYAWGPHLHFELRDNGRLRDPAPLFTGNRSTEVNGPLVELDADDAPSAAAGGERLNSSSAAASSDKLKPASATASSDKLKPAAAAASGNKLKPATAAASSSKLKPATAAASSSKLESATAAASSDKRKPAAAAARSDELRSPSATASNKLPSPKVGRCPTCNAVHSSAAPKAHGDAARTSASTSAPSEATKPAPLLVAAVRRR